MDDIKRFLTPVLFLVSLMFLFFTVGCGKTKYQREVNALNKTYDAKIYVYGENIDFKYRLQYEMTSDISSLENDVEYSFVILNVVKDDVNSVFISEVKELENQGFTIIYLNFLDYYSKIKDSGIDIIGNENELNYNNLYLINYKTKISIIDNGQDGWAIVNNMFDYITAVRES